MQNNGPVRECNCIVFTNKLLEAVCNVSHGFAVVTHNHDILLKVDLFGWTKMMWRYKLPAKLTTNTSSSFDEELAR